MPRTRSALLAACCLLALSGGALARPPRGLPADPAPAPPLDPGAALPPLETLTILDLSAPLVASFTQLNGHGSLYAACRNTTDPHWIAQNATRACDLGLQCCGYLGSHVYPHGKVPDTCVRAAGNATECPRTFPGAEGAPCGPARACFAPFVCCDAMPFMHGATALPIPTCQNASTLCPPPAPAA